jgi:predicted metal-dependent hydrolase
MPTPTPDFEPRYLAGVVLFNRRDFFEAHEVWEDLWLSPEVGADRRFVQGLIQAAVGLFHFGENNLRGAKKLYGTARTYMEAYPSPYLGMDHASFWRQMERCFAGLLAAGDPPAGVTLDERMIPTIRLDPLPAEWPDPAMFLHEGQ